MNVTHAVTIAAFSSPDPGVGDATGAARAAVGRNSAPSDATRGNIRGAVSKFCEIGVTSGPPIIVGGNVTCAPVGAIG